MSKQRKDLNQFVVRYERDKGITGRDGNITVYFSNLERHMIEHIKAAEVVVGCVAWLTNQAILDALASALKGVSIIVQKEEFLRPDSDAKANWRDVLRSRYIKLRSLPTWPGLLDIVTAALIEDNVIEPVRCVGIYNRKKLPASPRMHHKFLVFCRLKENMCLKPYAVWTGSFNLTANATKSLENAVYITDPIIVDAYYEEWQQVAFVSESLDWDQDWIQPEWNVT